MAKRKLKKPVKNFLTWSGRAFILLLIIGIGLTVWGLIEPQDLVGTPISGDYQLVKENSRSAYISRKSDGEVIVPSIVISYSVSGDYIAARRTNVPESEDVKPDFTNFTYWLIDTDTSGTIAQLSSDEFTAACTEKNLTFDEWLGT